MAIPRSRAAKSYLSASATRNPLPAGIVVNWLERWKMNCQIEYVVIAIREYLTVSPPWLSAPTVEL